MIQFKDFRDRVWIELRRCAKIVSTDYPIKSFPVKVHYHLTGRAAGMACGFSEIYLNSEMLLENPAEIEPTTAHEFAHLVVAKVHPDAKPHGAIWSGLMKQFGHKPERTHQMRPAQSYREKYTAICKCQEHYLTSRQFANFRRGKSIFVCKICNDIIRELT